MMAENLNNSSWATDPNTPSNLVPWNSDFQVKQQTGIAWVLSGGGTPVLNNVDTSGLGLLAVNSQLNQFKTGQRPNSPLNLALSGTMPYPDGLGFSRPSSQHPGGAGMIFCDGHYQFIVDEVPYKVITQMMTPNQRNVKLGNLKTVTQQGWNYILSEADYN